MTTPMKRTALPRATLRDTLGIVTDVVVPTIAKGVIIRRPRMVALAERFDLDRRAVRRMQRLREVYGAGPLLLRLPVRRQALLLSPGHVRRVLDGTPTPFGADTSEKRAALAHFEPGGVLISSGSARVDRRRFNEAVLDTPYPVHRLGAHFITVVDEEARDLLLLAHRQGELDWDLFVAAWFRVVRRVVLGDSARDDHVLTDLLARLRADANWAFLRPRRAGLRRRFDARLRHHLERAEPGSLVGMAAATPATTTSAPAQQVPQWLFAFDAAGMATFRALALLAAHPDHAAHARDEIASRSGSARTVLPYLRACILESVRLWPTTPAVLRQSIAETTWETGLMPPRTDILIFAPFFHRDARHLPEADRFAPELWSRHRAAEDWPLIPFSEGPAVCPGQNLVLLLSSAMLAALLDDGLPRLRPGTPFDDRRALPGTLNPFTLRFTLAGEHPAECDHRPQ
jgi:cytochrome P450